VLTKKLATAADTVLLRVRLAQLILHPDKKVGLPVTIAVK
jgi:hypothetical protein